MLKAKLKSSSNRRKDEAMREVTKMDNDKAIFARISSKEMRKLRMHLLTEEMSVVDWVKEKIREI